MVAWESKRGFKEKMQLLRVAGRAGHSPRWPLKHRPGVMDRDFCRPRNTLGVGEAATGNKTFSVPRVPGRPEAAHTLQRVNMELMLGHLGQSNCGLPSCGYGWTCLHPYPSARDLWAKGGHSDALLRKLRLGKELSQFPLTAHWTTGDTESPEEGCCPRIWCKLVMGWCRTEQ